MGYFDAWCCCVGLATIKTELSDEEKRLAAAAAAAASREAVQAALVRRFRMIAGSNGSGKSTLVRRLRDDYSVNFYDFLNADDIIEQDVSKNYQMSH